jgi:hypothetical protein
MPVGRVFFKLFHTFLFFFALIAFSGVLEKELTFNRNDISFTEIEGYDFIKLEGCRSTTREIGAPCLPRVAFSVLIPQSAEVIDVEVVSADTIELEGKYEVYPTQHPQPFIKDMVFPFIEPDEKIYSQAITYPEKVIQSAHTGSMGGFNLANLCVYPIRYIPANKKLIFHSKINLRVIYEDKLRSRNTKTEKQNKIFKERIEKLILNPEDIEIFEPYTTRFRGPLDLPANNVEYVIITADSFQTAFQELADWKTKKGVPAKVVTLDSIYADYSGADNAERIRNFIKEANSSWGTIWVLLGGQCDYEWGEEIVPRRNVWYVNSNVGHYPDEDTIPSDLYFSDLDGNWDADGDGLYGESSDEVDLYSDVFVGRAPVRTVAQAETFVNKVLTYEKIPPAGYQKKILLPAAILWSYYNEKLSQEAIANIVPADWQISRLYERDGNLTHAAFVDSVNSGFGFAHLVGHGNEYGIYTYYADAYFNSNDLDASGNDGLLGIHNSIGCMCGGLDLVPHGDCFAEYYLTPSTGGSFSIMNSRYGWGCPPSMGPSEHIDTCFYHEIFKEDYPYHDHLGVAHAFSKNGYVPQVTWWSTWAWCIYELNLFGDPEMPLWTDNPKELSVNHDESIPVGASTFNVNVSDGGFGVEGALVCLYKEGEVYQRGYTDVSGIITLTLSPTPTTLGTMYCTVTKSNYIPYEGSLEVMSPSAPWVVFEEYRLMDITGNSDGNVDPGESIELLLTVHNVGLDTAYSITGTLRTEDSYVAIIDSTEAFGDTLLPDSLSENLENFNFDVAPECPANRVIHFELITKDVNDNTWMSFFAIPISTPDITLSADTLIFNTVFIGYPDTLELYVNNDGRDTLFVNNITCDNNDYSVDIDNFNLPPDESQTVKVVSDPSSEGISAGNLTIESNDLDEPSLSVFLYGEGLEPPDISVSPDSLSDSLLTGETSIDTLTIYNTGGSDLEFDVWIERLDSDLINSNSFSMIIEAVIPASTSGNPETSPKQFLLSSSSEKSISFPAGLTLKGDTVKVLLLTPDRNITDLEAVLSAFSDLDVTVFPRIDLPGLDVTDLIPYDVVIITNNFTWWEYGNVTPEQVGDALADYIDSGGKAIANNFVYDWMGWQLEGRFIDEQYGPFTPATTDLYGTTALGTVHEPNHPIMTGVSTITNSYIWQDPGLAPNAIRIADWDDGNIFCAANDNVVAINILPGDGFGDPGWTGDLPTLYHNSILWLNGNLVSWLSYEPDTGTVSPDDSIKIEITFDAIGLNGGDYFRDIIISSNDPDESEISVFTHLKVTGIPDIAVSEDTLDYGTVFTGFPYSDTLIVTNEGTDLLTVSAISSDDPDYTVNITDFTLDPGETQEVVVTLMTNSAGLITGNLTIESDDPDESMTIIFLKGEGLEPPDISVLPESLNDSLFTGETSTHFLTIYNTGLSDLTFYVSGKNTDFPLSGSSNTRFSQKTEIENNLRFQRSIDGKIAIGNQSESIFRLYNSPTALGTAKIAILGSESPSEGYLDNVAQYLIKSGRFAEVATINGHKSTPTLAELQIYDAVGVFGWYIWDNADDIGNLLADYIDWGGNVFIAFIANGTGGDWMVKGRFNIENYWLISPYSYDGGIPYSMGTVLEPTHYIMNGVSTLISGSKLDSGASVSGDATLLAEFEDGTPLVAIKKSGYRRRVDISFPFVTYVEDGHNNNWGIDTTSDARLLIINAFQWLTVPTWLSADPTLDTIQAGDSLRVEITFDAYGLYGGDYFADIIVSSNDPDEPKLFVPAHLHVTGAPDITVSEDTMNYGIVFNGYSSTDTLIVSNKGTDLLTVSDISPDNPDYTVDTTNFSLNSNETRGVVVTFTPSSLGTITGTLTITSDDPDEPTLDVLLKGECVEPPDISVSPDSLSDSLFTGETSTDTLTIFNTGLSDLYFKISNLPKGYSEYILTLPNTKSQGSEDIEAKNKKLSVRTSQIRALLADLTDIKILFDISHGQSSSSTWSTIIEDITSRGATLVENSSEITLELLNQYNVLWVIDNYTSWSSSEIEAVKNWVINGGALLLEGDDDSTVPIYNSLLAPLNSGIEYSTNNGSDGTTTNIYSHETTVNVNSIYLNGNLAHLSTVTEPASCLINDIDDIPNTAFSIVGVGKVLAMADELFANHHFGSEDNQLFANQVFDWLAKGVDWLHTEPVSDTIPAADSATVEVMVDATGLDGGNYLADIIVSSNDPDEPKLLIPAHLHVTGAPDIFISEDTLNYGIVFNGYSYTDTLIVSNKGADLLTVSAISSDNPDYTVDTTNFSLNPKETRGVVVTFTPSSLGTINGILTITSDDPDEPTSDVLLKGECVEPPDISVSPDSLNDSLFTGETSTNTLTIYNTGVSDLFFDISIEKKGGVILGLEDAVASIIQRSEILEGEIRINSIEEETGKSIERVYKKPEEIAGTKYALNPINCFARPSIAILAADDFNSFRDVRDKLLSTGKFNSVTFIDANVVTPTLTELKAFDAVMVWNNTRYLDRTSLGDNLADYVDAGGGVVLALFESAGVTDMMLGGRWESEQYYIIIRNYLQTGQQFLGTVAVPTHPIMNGVTNFDGGISSFRPTNTRLTSGSTLIASWSDGNPLVAVKEIKGVRRVDLGFHPPSSDMASNLWQADTDGDLLMANAIEWVAGTSWLSADPESDTVLSADSVRIEFTFDATYLHVDDYYADIIIGSNDPDKPELIVPTHLHVLGSGIEEEKIPKIFFVKQNYPNPFNSHTVIRYGCPEEAEVCIQIFDCLGRIIHTLIDEEVEAGYHEVRWDGSNKFGKKVANAVYFYRMHTNKDFMATRKMILLR